MLTPSHFDTLGIGALLAVLGYNLHQRPDLMKKILNISLGFGLLLLGIVFVSKLSHMSSNVEFVLGEIGAGFLFVWVIGMAANGFRGPIGFVLNQPKFIYLGKISYGMYVYHWFVPAIVRYALPRVDVFFAEADWSRFLVFSAISIVLAMISWHLMERPILTLKQYFSYSRQKGLLM